MGLLSVNSPRSLASVVSPLLGSLCGKRDSSGAMSAVREDTTTNPSHQAPSQPSSPSLRPPSKPGTTYSRRHTLVILSSERRVFRILTNDKYYLPRMEPRPGPSVLEA